MKTVYIVQARESGGACAPLAAFALRINADTFAHDFNTQLRRVYSAPCDSELEKEEAAFEAAFGVPAYPYTGAAVVALPLS